MILRFANLNSFTGKKLSWAFNFVTGGEKNLHEGNLTFGAYVEIMKVMFIKFN